MMAEQRSGRATDDTRLDGFWSPLEVALEQVGELLAANDPTPRQFREISPDDTGFGMKFLVGMTSFFDTLRIGSAAFSLMLARRGWYPGGNLPLGILSESATLLSDGDAEGERMLSEYYDSEALALERSLVAEHPIRGEAIHQSFEAHAAGNYWLTVPSFIILAEAIAHDMGVSDLYAKNREGEKRLLEILSSREEFQVAVAVLAPLLVSVPIDWSPHQRQLYGNPILNRHAILHGESRDFGSKMNSLRAMSHLAYVSDVLGHFDSEDSVESP